MRKRLQSSAVLLLAAFLAGCQGPCDTIPSINQPDLSAGGADFTTYVAVGTSISAGVQSGGLVDRYQVRAFPALFARQTGKSVTTLGNGSFTQPTINQDGIPALLAIQSYSPLLISNAGRTTGIPTNFSQNTGYHDMGVPYAIALDFADTTHYYATVPPVNRSPIAQQAFLLVARQRGSIAAQALALQPTFMSIEYGANELLGPTTLGVAPSALTSDLFGAAITGAVNAIAAARPGIKMALLTVPDPTQSPYFTTFSPFTVSLASGQPVPLIGPGGSPLSAADQVTLIAGPYLAQGIGFAAGSYNYVNPAAPGTGQALPDSVVLSAAEAEAARTELAQMNAVVSALALRDDVVQVDMGGLIATLATGGLRLAGNLYTTDFITGGTFSLDGVHPNSLAHAVLANAMIDAVNARFGSSVPRVDPLEWATTSASAAEPAPPADLDRRTVRFPGGIRFIEGFRPH